MTMIQKLTACMLLFNFIIVGVLGYMLFWPVKFPIIYNEPFPVSPSVVTRGEDITYTIEFEKFKEHRVDVFQNIICEDGNLVTLAPAKSSFPLGRHTIDVTITVPQKASVSTCYIELKSNYEINAIRIEHKTMRTQSFQIIK